MSRESLATAARTAAINSGSGGSGMYSLAPAWIAATAARASEEMPQATIGTWMCSASRRITRSRMSRPTSTSNRSAPLPPRKTRIACSWSSACVTEAPLSMAILVVVGSWPFSVPTMRSRMVISWSSVRGGRAPFRSSSAAFRRVDDFRHGHAKLVFHQHHLATRNQAVVNIDVDGLADPAIEFEHRSGPEPEQFADVHLGAAEHRRDLHRDVEHRLEIGGNARGVLVLVIGDVVAPRSIGGVEIGKRDLCVGVAHGSILMAGIRPGCGTSCSARRVH